MEATRNSITEDGGQFPKNELQAEFNNFLSRVTFNNVFNKRNFAFYNFSTFP